MFFNSIFVSYSGCLVGETWPNVGVVAGTVFREVVLWTARDASDHPSSVPVLHRLKGHLGVIFCVCVNIATSLLCSTSDDRTTRVWRYCPSSANQTLLQVEHWENGQFSFLHVLNGHDSRVWRAVILNQSIITLGEDSKLCFWTHQGSLTRTQKFPGKGLWCVSASQDEKLVATGGKDGSLALYNVDREIDFCEVSLPESCSDEDFPRTLSLQRTSSGQANIVLTTESGLLLSYCLTTLIWRQLYKNESLKGYSILSVECENGQDMAVGNLTGSVFWIQTNGHNSQDVVSVTEHRLHESKIHSVLFLQSGDKSFLLSCGSEGDVVLWLKQQENGTNSLKKSYRYLLPVAKQRWVSAACVLNQFCILGDRMGSIHVYQLGTENQVPIQSFKGFHGRNGTTDIRVKNELVYTAGRDGKVAVFHLQNGTLDSQHRIQTTKNMEWIGKLIFSQGDLVVAGFKSTHFVGWSTEQQHPLLEVNCGGGHRSWDFHFCKQQMIFACTRRTKINFWKTASSGLESCITLRKGLHGDKIWCITKLFDQDEKTFYATGGEDNLIVVSELQASSQMSKVSPVLRLTGHISCVKALASHPLATDDECLLVSVGGRAQIMATKIILNKGVLMPVQLCSHFLWSCDIPPRQLRKSDMDLTIPLTRYMDVALTPDPSGKQFNVLLTCSDACIRLFSLNLHSPKLTQLVCVEEGRWCHLCILPLCPSDGRTFLTGSNCGTLRVWAHRFPSELAVTSSIKAHVAGINCISIQAINEKRWIICTGGDDNGLTISSLTKPNWCLQIAARLPSAHAAQISGVHIMSSPVSMILTSGIDQRLTIWKWSIQEDKISFSTSICTSVPDAAALHVTQNNRNACELKVCVVGEGLQVFRTHR